jgi:hypothetical protein
MVANIFHGSGVCTSAAEEVQNFLDFDQYSYEYREADCLNNYKQIFWTPQQIV